MSWGEKRRGDGMGEEEGKKEKGRKEGRGRRGEYFQRRRKQGKNWEVRKKKVWTCYHANNFYCWAQLYIRHCTKKCKHHHYVEFQQHLLENIIPISQMRKLRPGKARRGFPGGWVVKNLPANIGDVGLILDPGKLPWRRKWQPTQVLLPGESHRV